MKRSKSSSQPLSPFKQSEFFKFQSPFANVVNATASSSRASTPLKKKIDFYNFKNIIHVKDELQEKHQTDSITDNITTNFATPRTNSSLVMSNKRSLSVSKNNKSQIFQFLSPQTSRTSSPLQIMKSSSLFKIRTDLLKKSKSKFHKIINLLKDIQTFPFINFQLTYFYLIELKQEIDIYNFLKKDENFILKNIKNTRDPLVKSYQEDNHDKQDLIQNLKDKEKQFNRQKMFLIDQIQQKRFKNEREEREKLYIQMAKQQIIKNNQELQQDKIMADQIITNSFRKFTGSVNLYNLCFTDALDEPEGFCNKKSMKIQTCLLLPQKMAHLQESVTSPNTILSRKNSIQNSISISKQERFSNIPLARSQNNGANIQSIQNQSSSNAGSACQSPTKRIVSQVQQIQTIQNAIKSLQQVKNTTKQNNIFSDNQTERNAHNLKGVLKQKYSDINNNLKMTEQHNNLKDQSNNQKIHQTVQKQNIQTIKQHDTPQNHLPKQQNFLENFTQNQNPYQEQQNNNQQQQIPLIQQLQQQEDGNSFLGQSDSIILKSPTLSIKKQRSSLNKSQQNNIKIQLSQKNQNFSIDPIEQLDAMSENFTSKLLQLKQYEIDENFFSPVHDKYKQQISQIQSPKANNQEKYFLKIRHNKIKEVIEDLQANPELIFSVDNYFYTGLHWAVKRNYENLTQLLIEKGSNLQAKDYKNRTPYQLAVELGYFNITRIINQ